MYMLPFHYITSRAYLLTENLYSRNATGQFMFQESRMSILTLSYKIISTKSVDSTNST